MKCHYEVLNISREASGSEVKTAYRKLALQWHPDKNLDNLQEAKEQFQLVQNAYEVLSDLQERAWYDNHREQLLRGAGSSYNDDSLNVFPYFTPSCYKGFGDDPQGYYAVYSEVFSKLAAEETDYLDDPEDLAKIPKFGKSNSPYEEVHEFYAYWMAFSTNKSFVWLDQHDISQGDSRRIIKLMEKENNKIRQKARKERNEEIRRLVSFVRRKDKRVIEHAKQLQEKAEQNKTKAENLRIERIIQRQKEIQEAQKKQGESSFIQSEEYQKKLNEIESLLQEEFGITSDDDTISEGGMESSNEDSSKTEEASETSKTTARSSSKAKSGNIKNLYCSACNKMFKNVKSFENHEKSKKHKENVANMTFDEELDISDNDIEPPVGEQLNGKVAVEKTEPLQDSLSDHPADDDEQSISEDSGKAEVQMTKSQKKKKNKKKPFVPQPESEGNDSHDEMSFNEIEGPSRSRRAKKFTMLKNHIQAKKELNLKKDSQSHTSTENTDDAPNMSSDNAVLSDAQARPKVDDKPSVSKTPKPNKLKKQPDRKVGKSRADSETIPIDSILHCAVCRSEFSSKNRLFEHLKKTGHQVALAQASSQATQKKGKRANR